MTPSSVTATTVSRSEFARVPERYPSRDPSLPCALNSTLIYSKNVPVHRTVRTGIFPNLSTGTKAQGLPISWGFVSMVHRPADSRLLANLLSQEKDYSKQLGIVLETSQASLASFSAYASASAPPISQVILSVAGALAGADEALQRYLGAVDVWRDQLRRLKELESEVGNIMRDREIL